MDGNGRWAKRGLPWHGRSRRRRRKLPPHRQLLPDPRRPVSHGIRFLHGELETLSGGNRRHYEPLAAISGGSAPGYEKNQVHFVFFGDLSKLSPELRALCRNAETRSAAYHEVQVNFCLNYGGRDEIVQAARRFAEAVSQGEKRPEELDEALFSQYLYSANLPDPELIIRPSGKRENQQLSAVAIGLFRACVPGCTLAGLQPQRSDAAIAEFHRRSRRFGGV